MSFVDDVKRKLADRAEHKRISLQLTNIEYQLERIANALEVFSKSAENELVDAAEKAVKRRGGPGLEIGALDIDAANKAYRENTEAKGATPAPPPPDNENYVGGPT
jgi:hypothetical protein